MSTSLLPEAKAYSSVYVIGALCGCAAALLCTTLISHCMPASSAHLASVKQSAPLPIPSRRERAEKMLAEMRAQRAGAAARPAQKEDEDGAAGGGSAGGADLQASSTSGSSSWASTSEYDSSEDEEAEEMDSEYERMENLRLKMVFVVRHPVQPKMSAQEVAVLTATAGVQLVELQQQAKGNVASSLAEQAMQTASEPALPEASSSFVPDSEDRQRWRHWYLWWNRIGCGKITLRCPDRVAMDAVLAAALEMRLPVVQLHRSQFSMREGVMVQGCGVMTMGGDEAVVIALGPAPSDVLEPVTGSLKLFS